MRPLTANSVRAMVSHNPQWAAVLEALDQDLVRRAVSPNTRQAYATDTQQFATWASGQELDPRSVTVRDLRRYLAVLVERGNIASTIARKLAALRALFRVTMEGGLRRDNPAELLHSPKRPRHLPRVLKPGEVATLLDGIPGGEPLELRDRALFELAYACGLRAQELVSLPVDALDFDAETVRVHGKGDKIRVVPVGEYARRALERYLAAGRPASGPKRRGRARRCSSPSQATSSRPPMFGGGCGAGRGGPGHRRRGSSTHTRTPCGILLPRTCSRKEPICARSKNCLATQVSRPPRSTLG